jgi:hypothetical protein
MVLLAGCWVSAEQVQGKLGDDRPPRTDSEDTGIEDPTDSTFVPPTLFDVLSLEPDNGTTAGGTEVRIVVDVLPGGSVPQVTFGGVPAVVTGVEGSVIDVLSPAGVQTGWADIEISVDAGSGRAPGSFYVWQDGAGLAGAVGGLLWVEVVGDYWADGVESYGFGWVGLTDPVDFAYRQLYTSSAGNDLCGPEEEFAGGVSYLDLGADLIVLDAGLSQIRMGPDPSDDSYELGLEQGDVSWGDVYELLPFGGAREWSSFSDAVPLVATPSQLDLREPQLDGSSPPTVRADIDLEWVPGGGSYILALLSRVHNDVTVDEIACVAVDDGAFRVPSSVWSDWSSGDVIYFTIGRVQELDTTLPHNQSGSAVAGVYFVHGAAYATAW